MNVNILHYLFSCIYREITDQIDMSKIVTCSELKDHKYTQGDSLLDYYVENVCNQERG